MSNIAVSSQQVPRIPRNKRVYGGTSSSGGGGAISAALTLDWVTVTDTLISFDRALHVEGQITASEDVWAFVSGAVSSNVLANLSAQAPLYKVNDSTVGLKYGSGLTLSGDTLVIDGDIFNLTNYYTKTNLQTSGQASVHWGNITNFSLASSGLTDGSNLAKINSINAFNNKQIISYSIADALLNIQNTNASGYGMLIRGGNGTNYNLSLRDYDNNVIGYVLGNGNASFVGNINTNSQYQVNGSQISTSNVLEGSRLYYTQTRFDTAFSAKSTSNLSEGTNLYFTNARVKSYADTLYVPLSRTVAGNALNADITISQILIALKTVDGSGSGLDADLLDGQHGSYYLQFNSSLDVRNSSIFPSTDGTGTYMPVPGDSFWDDKERIVFNSDGGRGTWSGILSVKGWHASTYAMWQLSGTASTTTDGQLYFRDGLNNTWNAWNKIWHSGNDGSGSGLDADLWDGIHRPTNLGYTSTAFTAIASGSWAYPIGSSVFVRPASGGTAGGPGEVPGYWFMTGRRDVNGGYSGMFTSYSGGDSYIGSASDSTLNPTWRKIWDSGNSNLSTIDWHMKDAYIQGATKIYNSSGVLKWSLELSGDYLLFKNASGVTEMRLSQAGALDTKGEVTAYSTAI